MFVVLLMMPLSSCNMSVGDGRGKTVSFADLPQAVQDTVMYWTENYAPIPTNPDSLISIGEGMPAVISFDGKYTLDCVEFGPWTTHIKTQFRWSKIYVVKQRAWSYNCAK